MIAVNVLIMFQDCCRSSLGTGSWYRGFLVERTATEGNKLGERDEDKACLKMLFCFSALTIIATELSTKWIHA
jgi:hypothetical protein